MKVGKIFSKCQIDSGADVSIIRRDILDVELLNQAANKTVNFYSAFGHRVKAQLINVPGC